MKSQQRKTYKTKNCFFENISKIDKCLARLPMEKKTKNTQMINVRNERGDVTTHPETERTRRGNCEQPVGQPIR